MMKATGLILTRKNVADVENGFQLGRQSKQGRNNRSGRVDDDERCPLDTESKNYRPITKSNEKSCLVVDIVVFDLSASY